MIKPQLGKDVTIQGVRYVIIAVSPEPFWEFDDGTKHYCLTVRKINGDPRDILMINDTQIDKESLTEAPPLTINEIYQQLEWWEEIIAIYTNEDPTSEFCWEISEDVFNTLRNEWVKINDRVGLPLKAPLVVGEMRGHPVFVTPTKKRHIRIWKEIK